MDSFPHNLELTNGAISLTVDRRAYRLSAIKKAAYRLADRCATHITTDHSAACAVSLRFKKGTSEEAAKETARAFLQELLDQELREQIAEETAPLRALILAHAFSKTDLVKRDK